MRDIIRPSQGMSRQTAQSNIDYLPMPNLLAHIGVQGIVSRGLLRKADAQWILLGCLIPDIPWILQRIARGFELGLDPYDVRLYAITQASLACCLLLCGACACLAIAPRRVFVLLSMNSLLHLLLDACQTKWANGVHLFAPFSWKLLNFDLFWPESLPSYFLTALGIVGAGWLWWRTPDEPYTGYSISLPHLVTSLLLFLAYLGVPLLFWHGPVEVDNHFVRTLRQVELRPGREVEFDRNDYLVQGESSILRTFAGEDIALLGRRPSSAGSISVRGSFQGRRTIRIREFHMHTTWLRDSGSYVGLAIIFLFWGRAAWRSLSIWPSLRRSIQRKLP
jgi:hypothetical protein